ncbi:hypothetical protein ACFLV8_01730 [Chloroflexota bacterium]
MPSTLAGVYKPDEYQKSQEYTRSHTRFGLVTSAFSLLVILLFWVHGWLQFFGPDCQVMGLRGHRKWPVLHRNPGDCIRIAYPPF